MANIFTSKSPFFLDGGTGTHMIAAGFPEGACMEQWILEHPDVFQNLQREYVKAGSNAVFAPTFGANRAKLSSYGLGDKVDEINQKLVSLSREAVGNDILVGADLSTTGLFIPPYGDTSFDEIYDIYREQIESLVRAGVDFIGIETALNLWEPRAAAMICRELDIPFFASITVDQSGHTLMGTTLAPCVVCLQAMGASAVGINCSNGPVGLEEQFRQASKYAKIPLSAKPNAGLPDDSKPSGFDLTVEEFADGMKVLAESGASILGGCCGTGPAHIAAIQNIKPTLPDVSQLDCLANEKRVFVLPEAPVISRPITCGWELEDDLLDLEDTGTDIACVLISSAEDCQTLAEAASSSPVAIAISCSDSELLDKALMLYQGRAAVLKDCIEDSAALIAVAEKYGAVIL